VNIPLASGRRYRRFPQEAVDLMPPLRLYCRTGVVIG